MRKISSRKTLTTGYSALILMLAACLSGCVSVYPEDTELENPFEGKYSVEVVEARGAKGHSVIQSIQDSLDKPDKNASKKIKLSYSVKNKVSEMDSIYGKIVLPFEIVTLGILDLLGMPSDFVAQTVYMNATVYDAKGRELGDYSGTGRAWHTVAVYYGYSSKDAQKLADARAFNKALSDLYDKIENNDSTREKSTGRALTSRDFDSVVNHLVRSIVDSGKLDKKKGKYILAISDIDTDTIHDVDTDVLIKKLRIALQKENKVIMSTMSEDKMIMKTRELRNSEETNQGTIAKKNSLAAPDISLTGKIVEKELSGGESEYIFMFTINNLEEGVSLWEGEKSIIKED